MTPARPGTLYRVLSELRDDGLIERVPSPEGEHPHRKYDALTGRGRERLAEAVRELDAVRRAARSRLDHLLPSGA